MNFSRLFIKRNFALAMVLFVAGLLVIVVSSMIFRVKDIKRDFYQEYGEIKANLLAESAIEIEFLRFLTFFDKLSTYKVKDFNNLYRNGMLQTNIKLEDYFSDGNFSIKKFRVISYTKGSAIVEISAEGRYKRARKRLKKVLKVGI